MPDDDGVRMSLEVVLELLQLLKTPKEDRTKDAPIGNSHHEYYYTDSWTNYLWKYIIVVDHDYDKKQAISQASCLSP